MEIWRVENSDGQGPYANSTSGSGLAFECAMRELAGKSHDLNYRHPVVSPERCYPGEQPLFGFKSRSDLDHWFGYFGEFGYDVLRDNGFAVNVYEVDDDRIEFFPGQVVYDPESARWLRNEELSNVS